MKKLSLRSIDAGCLLSVEEKRGVNGGTFWNECCKYSLCINKPPNPPDGPCGMVLCPPGVPIEC